MLINEMLRYEYDLSDAGKTNIILKQVQPVDFNSFDHNNYKKDTYDFKSIKGKNYYGKKRRSYTDYC